MKKKITADSMILLRDTDGVADSPILTGFRSMIEAEAVTRARAAGYEIDDGYIHSGEFGIDIAGETGAYHSESPDGTILPDGVKKVLYDEITASLTLNVNGFPARAAASGLINVKPTYGTVSRYGVVSVVPSAETVSITAKTAAECAELLKVISGCDEKDPTTIPDRLCPFRSEDSPLPVRRVGVFSHVTDAADDEVGRGYTELQSDLRRKGADTVELSREWWDLLTVAHAVWNTVLCAEAWGSLSRYDGVRFGKRSTEYSSLNDLYVNSRSEGFGALVKAVLLYGSYALSPDAENESFFRAARIREWVKAETERLFTDCDALLLPIGSVPFYTEENVKNRGITAFNENFYTALPSLCGLPTVTVRGVQIIGKPFSDASLLQLAQRCII